MYIIYNKEKYLDLFNSLLKLLKKKHFGLFYRFKMILKVHHDNWRIGLMKAILRHQK